MKKVVIFGNSGSGKSTLARHYHEQAGLPHLDLDTIAWLPATPPARKAIADSKADIDRFMAEHASWVIEGCYSDLLELVIQEASEIVFLDLPIERCIANAKNRPWESHKYESKAAQDANLDMLLEWITQYPNRNDTFSRSSHKALYENYDGKKSVHTCNVSLG